MSLDSTDEDEKVDDSIRTNREFYSNEMDKSDFKEEKHLQKRTSRLRGIPIDSRDEYENTDNSIRFNRESDSNEIDENDSQVAQQE
jgi:hypothetical protein